MKIEEIEGFQRSGALGNVERHKRGRLCFLCVDRTHGPYARVEKGVLESTKYCVQFSSILRMS